jgi:CMP-N-acetylneuraminic acid synthetase/regulator of RNase E activity RraA
MKITAVIPIRSASKRCRNKSIRAFYDTTLLELRINILKKVKGIDIIQVNSDCDIILNKAKQLGVEIFKRDPVYASDEADGKMVYKCLSDACTTEIMLIAFTPTPFIDEHDYQNCINIFKNGECDSVISVQHKKDYMFYNKKPVNFNPLKTCQSQNLPNYYSMTFGVTIVNTDFVKKNHSIWTENPHFYEVDELKAMDIDTNMDFLICEEIYKKHIRNIEDLDKYMNCRNDILNESLNNDIPDDVYLGAVYDALNIMVDDATRYVLNIKPVAGYSKIIYGPALTLYGRKITKEEDYSEMDNKRFQFYNSEFYKNEPIIVLQSNDDTISHTGDITSKIFKKLGAKGYITDGIARDIELIEDINFPVFCRDVNPIDAISNNWAYTDINIPIKVDNLLIYPNDYIFASKDGVIIIPRELYTEFVKQLNLIMEKERDIRIFVNNMDKNNLSQEIEQFIKKKGRF